MHVLITGAAGRVGSHTVEYFIARGHSVTAVDIATHPPQFSANVTYQRCDLTDAKAVDALFDSAPSTVGVVHLAAVPGVGDNDHRHVHNTNVTASYNIMQTAASRGITRISQASSVHAIGLNLSPPGHQRFGILPITEEALQRPEDPYALSKVIAETQAAALCRYYPALRIASLRLHLCVMDYATAVPLAGPECLCGWTSLDAVASAMLLGLTSSGWKGDIVCNISAPEIAFDGDASDKQAGMSSLDMLGIYWKGKHGAVDEKYWQDFPRRSFFDTGNAEQLLGWSHDRAGEL